METFLSVLAWKEHVFARTLRGSKVARDRERSDASIGPEFLFGNSPKPLEPGLLVEQQQYSDATVAYPMVALPTTDFRDFSDGDTPPLAAERLSRTAKMSEEFLVGPPRRRFSRRDKGDSTAHFALSAVFVAGLGCAFYLLLSFSSLYEIDTDRFREALLVSGGSALAGILWVIFGKYPGKVVPVPVFFCAVALFVVPLVFVSLQKDNESGVFETREISSSVAQPVIDVPSGISGVPQLAMKRLELLVGDAWDMDGWQDDGVFTESDEIRIQNDGRLWFREAAEIPAGGTFHRCLSGSSLSFTRGLVQTVAPEQIFCVRTSHGNAFVVIVTVPDFEGEGELLSMSVTAAFFPR